MPKPETPPVTVDIIIELQDLPDRPIVIIERHHPPLGLALPGGFVDVGERVENAALREAAEETSLNVQLLTLLGLYSDPQRDPRGQTVSAVYIAQAHGRPTAASDAKNIMILPWHVIPNNLVFDHALILEDYRNFRQYGHLAPLRPLPQ